MNPADLPSDVHHVMQIVSQQDPTNEVNIYARNVDGKVEMITTETNPAEPKPIPILLVEDSPSTQRVIEVLKAVDAERKNPRIHLGVIGHMASSKLSILAALSSLSAKIGPAQPAPKPTPEMLRRMALMDGYEPVSTCGEGDTRGRKAYNKSKRPRWRQP